MRRSQESKNEYVYLIQEREFVKSNEQTYKIGRTSSLYNRLSAYPKDSEIIMLCNVDNSVEAESILKDRFKHEFKQQRQYGSEYFFGDVKRMQSVISQLLFNKQTTFLQKPPKQNWFQLVKKKIFNKPPNKKLPELPLKDDHQTPPNKPLPALPQPELLESVQSVTKEKIKPTFQCHKCCKVLATNQKLLNHLNKKYSCDMECCGNKYKSKVNFLKHKREMHPRVMKRKKKNNELEMMKLQVQMKQLLVEESKIELERMKLEL